MSNKTSSEGTPQVMRNVFGIIMILVYIGMGVLMFINFFQFSESWTWLRWTLGILFVVYGFWRAYRQFKGTDYSRDE